MRHLLLAGIGAGLLAVGPAIAADMAVKAPMMAPPPAFSWTGCYIGIDLGYGMWNQDTFHETDPGHTAISPTQTGGGRGWFGGGQIGCDYQVSPNWVIGAQGNWDDLSPGRQTGASSCNREGSFGSVESTPPRVVYHLACGCFLPGALLRSQRLCNHRSLIVASLAHTRTSERLRAASIFLLGDFRLCRTLLR